MNIRRNPVWGEASAGIDEIHANISASSRSTRLCEVLLAMTQSAKSLGLLNARTSLRPALLAALCMLALCSCRSEYAVRRPGVARQAEHRAAAYRTLPAEAFTGAEAYSRAPDGNQPSYGA